MMRRKRKENTPIIMIKKRKRKPLTKRTKKC